MGERLISQEGLDALSTALCGSYSLPIGEGSEVRVFCGPLPGRAIAVTARVKGVLWVCLDLDKPAAPRHAMAMLEEWRKQFLGDVAIPAHRKQPCPLSLSAA